MSHYPLPWCVKLDRPYCAVNLMFCYLIPGWREKQAHQPMSVIIPWIDEVVNDERNRFKDLTLPA